MEDETMDLARCILAATELRENSYNKNTGEYDMNIRSAVCAGAENSSFDMRITPLVLILVTQAWNESIEWANKVLNNAEDAAFTI